MILRAATHLVKLLDHLHVQKFPRTPPHLDSIIDPQPGTQRARQDVPAIRAPLARRRVRRLELGHLFPRFQVPDVDRPCQVSKPGVEEQSALRLVGDKVSRLGFERVDRVGLEVKEDRSGGHVCRIVR